MYQLYTSYPLTQVFKPTANMWKAIRHQVLGERNVRKQNNLVFALTFSSDPQGFFFDTVCYPFNRCVCAVPWHLRGSIWQSWVGSIELCMQVSSGNVGTPLHSLAMGFAMCAIAMCIGSNVCSGMLHRAHARFSPRKELADRQKHCAASNPDLDAIAQSFKLENKLASMTE